MCFLSFIANYIEYIGLVAGFCTTTSSVPQLMKMISTKNVRDVSALTYGLMTIGLGLWLIYGVYHHSWPLIICNSISLVFSSAILFLKLSMDIRKH